MKRLLLLAACAAISLSAYSDREGLEKLSRESEFKYDIVQVKIGDLYYNLSSKEKTARVVAVKTGEDKYAGVVRIPGSVTYQAENYTVIRIDNSAFKGCKDLTNVYVGDGVLGITNQAFNGCTNLTSVRFPKGMSNVGYEAFNGCAQLDSVIVSDMATWCTMVMDVTSFTPGYEIGLMPPALPYGLYDEDGKEITELVIPDGVTEVNNFTFRGCRSITSVKLPASVQSIGYKAFSECKNLKSVDLSGTLKEAGRDLFMGCSSLCRLTLPGSLKTIPEHMCDGCTSLEEIAIPEGVENIETNVFLGCTSLMTVHIPSTMKTINDVLGQAMGRKIIIPDLKTWCGITFNSPAAYGATLCLEDGTELNDLVFPDDVTAIPQNAFGGYRGLNSIDFNKVETIGDFAFQESDIESLTLSESVREIRMAAFQSCQNLSSISLPSSIEKLSDYAFAFCPSLTSVSYNLEKFPEYGRFASAVFSRSPIDKATLYVPEDMIEACKGEEPWSGFGQILPLPTGTETSIQGAECQVEKEKSAMYDLQGRKLNAVPEKGLYIQGGKMRMAW